MPLRLLLIAVLVLGVGGLGALMLVGMSTPPPAASAQMAAAPAAKVLVLAAARPLRAGNLLKVEDILGREVDAAGLPAGARPDTPDNRRDLTGAMVRRMMEAGDAILPGDVLRPGEHGFLAAVLHAGMRATTVGVDAVSGTAGLIWPGDRIDLILTQVQDDATLPAGRRASAETMLTDVRVIAIDQQLMQGAVASGKDPGLAHTVTLEVSPEQAERVAVATRLGRLSLTVRAADTPDAPYSQLATQLAPEPGTPAPITWGGDVSPALNMGHATGKSVKTWLGKEDGKEVRF